MLRLTRHVDGAILWANLHLLFWLSLVPFVTGWMGESHFAPVPTAACGGTLLLSSVAYAVLQRTILASQGPGSVLAAAAGADLRSRRYSGHFAGLSLIGTDAQREPNRHARGVVQQDVEAMLGERARARDRGAPRGRRHGCRGAAAAQIVP